MHALTEAQGPHAIMHHRWLICIMQLLVPGLASIEVTKRCIQSLVSHDADTHINAGRHEGVAR